MSRLILPVVLMIASVLLFPSIAFSATQNEIVNSINARIDPDLSDAAVNKMGQIVNGSWNHLDEWALSYKDNSTELDDLVISVFGNHAWIPVVINGTVVNATEPEPCKPNEHMENGHCVPNPQPGKNETVITFEGDLGSSSVFNAVKNVKADGNVALGDLTYGSTLANYMSSYATLTNSHCVIGNHDSDEDGSGPIIAQALAQCGELWSWKPTTNTLIIGFNSNGNIGEQKNQAVNILNTQMDGVKNLVIVSHKACISTPPNSHHPFSEDPQVGDFCSFIKPQIPAGVQVFYINGHNHVYSEGENGGAILMQVGSGGKSHYTCGTGGDWSYCNNQVYGFLKMTINDDTGSIATQFINTQGGVVH